MNETNELFIKYQMMVSLSQFHYNNSTPVTLCFWYLKYSLCIKKQKLQQLSSHNEWNIPVCQWYAMINKAWIMGACESLMIIWGVIRDDTISWRSLSKTTVWLERCYSWCLIAFCRQKKKKYWQTVHHSCWINHLSTSQKWLERSFILHVYLLIKVSGET